MVLPNVANAKEFALRTSSEFLTPTGRLAKRIDAIPDFGNRAIRESLRPSKQELQSAARSMHVNLEDFRNVRKLCLEIVESESEDQVILAAANLQRLKTEMEDSLQGARRAAAKPGFVLASWDMGVPTRALELLNKFMADFLPPRAELRACLEQNGMQFHFPSSSQQGLGHMTSMDGVIVITLLLRNLQVRQPERGVSQHLARLITESGQSEALMKKAFDFLDRSLPGSSPSTYMYDLSEPTIHQFELLIKQQPASEMQCSIVARLEYQEYQKPGRIITIKFPSLNIASESSLGVEQDNLVVRSRFN